MPCGGNGLCGKCKVRVDGVVSPISEQEKSLLTIDEIKQGVRLACFTRIEGDCIVSIPDPTMRYAHISENTTTNDAPTASWNYAVVVDIGTTTIAAVLCDGYGRILEKTTVVNPQTAWGADVLTRAEAATAGEGERLTECIRACVNEQIAALCTTTQLELEKIDSLVITGNTVMLCLYTGETVEGFLCAPFRSACLFDTTRTAAQCGVAGVRADVPVYFPRCLDAFLGADFVCAMSAVQLFEDNRTALLLDIGTNSEMALWHQGTLYACSTAAGPAFEGVGISCGMPAVCGAIEHADVINHRLDYRVIGDGEIQGVCGSGLVDLLACLRQLQELDDNGCLLEDPYRLSDEVQLTQKDVHGLLISKSAIRSGLETLLYRAGITPDEVDIVYLAGGFGSTLHISAAVMIGLLPREISAKIQLVGNAALEGARRLLWKDKNDSIPLMRKVDLATDPYFADAFIRNMALK